MLGHAWMTPQQREKIIDNALQIIANTGILFQDKKALSLLADFGGKIDRRDGRVRIPVAKTSPLLHDHRPPWLSHQPAAQIEMAAGVATHIWNFEETKKERATVDHGSQIVALIDHLPYIHVASCGVRPSGMDILQAELWAAETVLTFTRKPFRVESTSPAIVQAILQMASAVDDLSNSTRVRGHVVVDEALTFRSNQLESLRAYSQYRQPVHFTPCAYANSLGMANILSLQIAEWLALVYYLVCAENASPLVWETNTGVVAADSSRQQDRLAGCVSLAWLAEMAAFYAWPLCYALSAEKSKWNFSKGWHLAVSRILPWLGGVDKVCQAGVVDDGFSVAQLVLENEVANYLQQIYNGNSFDSFSLPDIARYVAGQTEKTRPAVWKSEIFRYDATELWRHSKLESVRAAKDYISQLWWQTEAHAFLPEDQRQTLCEIKQRAMPSHQ